MASAKELLEEFHAFNGKDYGEVMRNLNAFGRDDKSAFLQEITPQSWRDERIYIKLLQMHNMHSALASVLLKEHRVSTKLILSDPNFMEYIYKNYTEIITKFSSLSYTLRAKLINKLSYIIDDEDKGFEIYTMVLNEFGLKVAIPLLISCNHEVIVEAITVDEVTLTQRQLIHCHKKSARLLEVYFKQNPCFDKCPKLAQHLCKHDLKTFQSLLKYGAPKIGRRNFKKFLKEYKAEFVRDCDALKNFFKGDVLARYLNEGEFVDFIRKLLPKSVDDFKILDWHFKIQLEMVPKNIRGRVIFAAFRDLYGFDIWACDSYSSKELLTLIPLEDRRKFDLSDRVEFDGTDVAIPALELQLRFTSELTARMELFRRILECCKVNDDLDALLEVLQKFCKDHANEDLSIRIGFMNRACEYFRFGQFSGEHWVCIDQMMMTFYLNGENTFAVGHGLEEFMKYKIKNGLDYTAQFKLHCKERGAYMLPTLSKNPELQRSVILKYGSIMDEVFEGSYEKVSKLAFLSAVIDFNLKHSELVIPLSYYKEYIQLALEEIRFKKFPDFYKEKELLRSLLIHQEDVDEILQDILISCTAKSALYITTWFLRKKPYILENNIEVLFKYNTIHIGWYYELSNLPNLTLHAKMMEYAVAVLKSPQEEANKICSSIKLLSFHKGVDLKELTRRWWPKPDCKIEAHEEGMKDLLEIHKTIISSFKNTFVVKNVDDILHFCNGDYTRYALTPLYSALFNAPEIVLNLSIRQLLGKPAIVRKHALHLSTYLCTLENKRKLLKYVVEHEKYTSVKKYTLKKLFKCLLGDRTEHDWALFSSNLNLIDPNDKELVSELLSSSKKIPKKFYTDFINVIWTHLSSRGKSEEFQVLLNIDYEKFTFAEFCDGIVQRSLFNPANELISETHVFVYHYLVESKASEAIWNRVLEASCRNDMKFQKELHELVKSICAQVLKAKANFGILETALGELQSLQIPQTKFGISVLLETTLSCKPTNLPDAKMTVDRLNSLVDRHGAVVANCYGEFVREFVHLFQENVDEIGLDLALGALKHSDGIAARLLCVHLLPEGVPKNESIRGKFLDLVGIIRDGASGVVAFELSKVVQNLEC